MGSSKTPSTSKGTKIKDKKEKKTPDGKAKKQRRHENFSVYIYTKSLSKFIKIQESAKGQ